MSKILIVIESNYILKTLKFVVINCLLVCFNDLEEMIIGGGRESNRFDLVLHTHVGAQGFTPYCDCS